MSASAVEMHAHKSQVCKSAQIQEEPHGRQLRHVHFEMTPGKTKKTYAFWSCKRVAFWNESRNPKLLLIGLPKHRGTHIRAHTSTHMRAHRSTHMKAQESTQREHRKNQKNTHSCMRGLRSRSAQAHFTRANLHIDLQAACRTPIQLSDVVERAGFGGD